VKRENPETHQNWSLKGHNIWLWRETRQFAVYSHSTQNNHLTSSVFKKNTLRNLWKKTPPVHLYISVWSSVRQYLLFNYFFFCDIDIIRLFCSSYLYKAHSVNIHSCMLRVPSIIVIWFVIYIERVPSVLLSKWNLS